VSLAAPRWAEADFFLGEAALGRLTVRPAEKHLVRALKGIPDLTAAEVTLGHVHLATEEFQLARDAYHRASASVPGQREAMLGEAKSLSFLGRHDDAIAILDEMERLGTWYMGETYYWRAWNRYRLKRYDAANDDVLASRSRLPMDGQVDKLAGFIALARNDVPRAEGEFRAAVTHIEGRGGTDCEARYYLGSALVMQRKWAEAVPSFETAEPCYVRAQEALRARIKDIRSSDLPDDRQDVLVAAKEKDIAAARLQEARSAYNAGVALANLGEPQRARPFAERAAAHPDLAAQANAILERIGKSGSAPAR
jgi:tetratricopeptide (TPR) repeat protein